jgi:hypothetical protein
VDSEVRPLPVGLGLHARECSADSKVDNQVKLLVERLGDFDAEGLEPIYPLGNPGGIPADPVDCQQPGMSSKPTFLAFI